MSSGTNFHNDQLYGIELWGEGDLKDAASSFYPPQVKEANNPPFIYPDRVIRTQDADGTIHETKMQRGYIRSMISYVEGAPITIRKCAFQFNPDMLYSNVSMSSDVINAYQQDVGQFAVPLASVTNFSFKLYFDRSMELNNSVKTGTGALASLDEGGMALGGLPGEIGVLRDVAELNAIIGAGITPQTQELAIYNAKAQVTAQVNAATLDSPDAYGPDTAKGKKYKTASDNLDSKQGIVSSANFGNTAFLLPLPVRVVFSSLYMVEGFASSVETIYDKFTTTMIPMRAFVTVNMSATYIGYAKKKTYTSESLISQKTSYVEQQSAAQTLSNELVAAAKKSVPSVELGSSWSNQTEYYLPQPDGGNWKRDYGTPVQYFLDPTAIRVANSSDKSWSPTGEVEMSYMNMFCQASHEAKGAVFESDAIVLLGGVNVEFSHSINIFWPAPSVNEAISMTKVRRTYSWSGTTDSWEDLVNHGLSSDQPHDNSNDVKIEAAVNDVIKIEYTSTVKFTKDNVFALGTGSARQYVYGGEGRVSASALSLAIMLRQVPLSWTGSVVANSTVAPAFTVPTGPDVPSTGNTDTAEAERWRNLAKYLDAKTHPVYYT